MKLNFLSEGATFSGETYPESKQAVVTHGGRQYKKIGETFDRDLSNKEKFVRVLGLIALVIAGIFSLGIACAFEGFKEQFSTWKNEVKTGKEKNVHCLPIPLAKWQLESIKQTVESINFNLNRVTNWPEPMSSAECSMRILFKGGELKHKFDFTNKNGDPLTKDQLCRGIQIMEDELKKLLKNTNLLSSDISYGYVIDCKDLNGASRALAGSQSFKDVSGSACCQGGSFGDNVNGPMALKNYGFVEGKIYEKTHITALA